MPAAEAYSKFDVQKGTELAALLAGTSRHPHPQRRVADIIRYSPADQLKVIAYAIDQDGSLDFRRSPDGALAHARSICGVCVGLNLPRDFERLIAGGFTLFSKALNFEEAIGILLGHVRPVSAIGNIIAARIARGLRQVLCHFGRGS